MAPKSILSQQIATRRSSRRRATTWSLAAAALACVIALACVTVNVNFPESAVQKATDDYVRDLYKAKEKGKTPTAAPSKSTSLGIARVLAAIDLTTDAHALDASDFSFKVETAKTAEIKDRQSQRLSELADKARGQWGEGKDGYLAVRATDDFKKKALLVKRVEKLVADENADRKELYGEVLSANKLPPARMIDIQKKFANSFREAAPEGTWIQDDGGSWAKK